MIGKRIRILWLALFFSGAFLGSMCFFYYREVGLYIFLVLIFGISLVYFRREIIWNNCQRCVFPWIRNNRKVLLDSLGITLVTIGALLLAYSVVSLTGVAASDKSGKILPLAGVEESKFFLGIGFIVVGYAIQLMTIWLQKFLETVVPHIMGWWRFLLEPMPNRD
ncbi:MAG: hypothetical protein V4474_03550 [Patescibacteria group bacterium]